MWLPFLSGVIEGLGIGCGLLLFLGGLVFVINQLERDQ